MKIKISLIQIQYFLFMGAFFALPMGTSPFTILAGCALVIWIFSGEFIRLRHNLLKEKWLPPVALIFVLAWAGLIWSPDPWGMGLKFAKKSHYWLYALAVASALYSGRSSEKLIRALLAGLCVNAFVGFMQYFKFVPIISKYETVYTGFHGGYNTLAILLVLGILTASFYFRKAGDKKTLSLYGFLMLVYFLHLIILLGRGGYLTFAVLSPVIVFNISREKGLKRMISAYLVIIMIASISPIVRGRFKETVNAAQTHLKSGESYSNGEKYSAPLDRIYMWRWSLHLFKEHPIIGVGTGGYQTSVLSSGGDMGIAHPHNNILHMAASYGLIGLIAFIWLFWTLLKAGWQNRHGVVGFFVLSSSLVILIGGATDTHILDAGGAFLLAVITGLTSALKQADFPEHKVIHD